MTKEEFEKAVREHRRYILKFVRKKVAEDDVEDIVQQVLKELADSKAYLRFRGDSSVKTWLVGAVRNRVLDWYRKRDRSRKKEKEIVDRLKLEQKLDAYQSPEDDLMFKEAEQSLERLPPDMQDAIRRYTEGASWAEVATELEINKKTLESRVRRYRKRLERDTQQAERLAEGKRAVADRKSEREPVMIIEDHLWHPDNLRLAKHLRQGGLLRPTLQPSDHKTKVELGWAPGIAQRINSALKRGDIEKLAQVLQNQPYAIAHPVVFRQIFHLSKLLRMTGAEELPELYEIGASIEPDEPILPAGAKQAAREALYRLVSAWVRGVLPGHTVDRIKFTKPRGRRPKISGLEALDLLNDFYELNEQLKEYPTTSFSPRPGEQKDDFIERIARLVQKLHLLGFSHVKTERIPDQPEFDASGKVNLFALYTHTIPVPVPREVALKVARQAIPKRSVRKRNLIYGLLAHHWQMSFDRVRRLIEEYKVKFPDLAPSP